MTSTITKIEIPENRKILPNFNTCSGEWCIGKYARLISSWVPVNQKLTQLLTSALNFFSVIMGVTRT